MSFTMCHEKLLIMSCWWLFQLTSWSLNLKPLCLKQPCSIMVLKSWKRMAKSATIWSACGCLYQVLKCSLWAYLSMWSLPNLLCAKFWDLLKMNIALAFLFSWRANLICSHLITHLDVCANVFTKLLQPWIFSLGHSCMEGEEYPL